MKKIIALLSIIVSLISCQDYSHRYVPKELIPDLKNNEIVCFMHSGKLDIDTFRVNIEEYWRTTQEGNSFQGIRYYYKKYISNCNFLSFVFRTDVVEGIDYGILYENTNLSYGIVNQNLNLNDLIKNNKDTIDIEDCVPYKESKRIQLKQTNKRFMETF